MLASCGIYEGATCVKDLAKSEIFYRKPRSLKLGPTCRWLFLRRGEAGSAPRNVKKMGLETFRVRRGGSRHPSPPR